MTTSAPTASTELLRPHVRRLTLDDLAACGDLAESRGWGREAHKWRLLLTAGRGYGVDAPDRPGALAGAFVLTFYPALPGGRAYTCVSMVLVAERFARRGLGRHLVRHALAESGDHAAFLSATPNGRPLYEELGFRPVGTSCMLRGPFTPAVGDDVRPAAVRPARAADLTAVRALDARAFGADRTELLARLPAFADRFVVAHDPDDPHGALTGFAASWPNDGTTVLGPVVAHDTATAQKLITDLALHAPGPVRFDLGGRHPELGDWLRARGLTGDFSCTLMVRTTGDIPGDPALRFAPYSVALG
ncbi:GNAT family N-acetyltransferase [Streptomyces sp. RKND-216]|uniref:GNAT family N-acetyltransferase n=1 Tax=Streptomyces sp. RKND-216 TaxID=2562581 RepID=UPI001FF9AC92|nr:GNAT family N-acetyltransferase [Streptomyces sp. RKND-216]